MEKFSKLSCVNYLNTKKSKYKYFSLKKLENLVGEDFSKLPFSMKIILENLIRCSSENNTEKYIKSIKDWLKNKTSSKEIEYYPARVLMQDFTGVPALVDLAAMRDKLARIGDDPKKINPTIPVDLVIDHSIQVDSYASSESLKENTTTEMKRNIERYQFLRWGQKAFDNFNVVPPKTGICHQVNLEYLSKVVCIKNQDEEKIAFPDTLVGTDSHTTMVNGLSVLGWGVGGIEAESAMLGLPIYIEIPEVIGVKLTGKIREGITATDVVLTITKVLRDEKVVGKFVEFCGEGLESLSLADRATIANMAPEYGATCGFFPIDKETINYLKLSGRDNETIELVEVYAKEQDMWHDSNTEDPVFTKLIKLDLSTIETCISGPKRPQDKITLSNVASEFTKLIKNTPEVDLETKFSCSNYQLSHGNIVIAAITSCTNTSNPSVMIAAGLLAKKAFEKGLKTKPWVKTTIAPGSKVVTEYLENSNLQNYLNKLGFNIVGYGCTTCIGNSGPLKQEIEETIQNNNLYVCSVLSGNRNFEGRVHPLVKANYLASPPLVVAYALIGSMKIDIAKEPLGQDQQGNDIYLKDIWPSKQEIDDVIAKSINPEIFKEQYKDVFSGDEEWKKIEFSENLTYNWSSTSTYIKNPPYFSEEIGDNKKNNIKNANILALLGDSITTDHISPAGAIPKKSPAATYLEGHNVSYTDFNSFGSRRGNHEVMMRGTFANIRIQNEMTPNISGGYTVYAPTNEIMSIYDASLKYYNDNKDLIVVAGKDYGMGSSRDWAAKGTFLLGVKAIIAESFERIHRSNLIGMGVLPLLFKSGNDRKILGIKGSEVFDIKGIEKGIKPYQDIECVMTRSDGSSQEFVLKCAINTEHEVEYYNHGGILHYVMQKEMISN